MTCKLSAAKSSEGSAVTWHCAPHTRGPYKMCISSCPDQFCPTSIASFGDAYEKIGTIQRRLAWPLHKDDTLFQSGRPTGLNIYFIFPSQLLRKINLLEDVANFPLNVSNFSSIFLYYLREVFMVSQYHDLKFPGFAYQSRSTVLAVLAFFVAS